MGKVPLVPISQDDLSYFIASLLVYQRYRREKTPPSQERDQALFVLALLIPKLQRGIEPQKGDLPLFLTVDEIQVMKGGLNTLLDLLNRRSSSARLKKEIARLKALKTLLDQHFVTTQD